MSLPFGIAPTGFTRMMQTEGEIAGASAAGQAGIPFALSMLGTTSIEDVKSANRHGRNWFQLYMWRDRDASMALVERAAKAGFDTLLVTVDVPVSGARLRDTRNGMTIPPTLTARTVLDALWRPRWWIDLLTTEPLTFATFDRWPGPVWNSWTACSIRRSRSTTWPGSSRNGRQSLWSKAFRPSRMPGGKKPGVDGIVLSNHGGRQLDRAPVPFHSLPSVATEFGSDVEIVLDTGIMSGADVVAAVALGARFTLVGRAYLYGLMAGGRARCRPRDRDPRRPARPWTMKLLGVTCLEELSPRHVTQLVRVGPAVTVARAAPRRRSAVDTVPVSPPARSASTRPGAARCPVRSALGPRRSLRRSSAGWRRSGCGMRPLWPLSSLRRASQPAPSRGCGLLDELDLHGPDVVQIAVVQCHHLPSTECADHGPRTRDDGRRLFGEPVHEGREDGGQPRCLDIRDRTAG